MVPPLMKASSGLVVATLMAGCAVNEIPETTATSEATQAVGGRCSDPETCYPTNGGGVYTEELGNAGIGVGDFMITHFVYDPTTDTESLQGRVFDTGLGDWTIQNGTIEYAVLVGTPGQFVVNHIVEQGTMPTFTLTPTGGGTPVPVTG